MPLKTGTTGKSKHAAAPGGANTSPTGLMGDDDKAKWVYEKDIPVFDEHSGADEDLDVDFTPEVLARIVEQNNARVRDTGDLIPVTKGHTGGDTEPPVLGWASNFRMGKIGQDNRACIYCDMQFTAENHAEVKKMAAGQPFPRRSIELWSDYCVDPIALTDRPILDTVALLGAERPARSLGLGEKKRLKKYTYAMSDTKEQMNPEQIKQLLEALQSTPEWQYLQQCVAEKAQMAEEEKPEEVKPEEEKKPKEEEPMPFEEGDDEEDDKKSDPAKLRMQRDQLKRRFAKLEAEFAAREKAKDQEFKSLFAKVANLERKERVAHRKAELMQLEAEGYAFDLADELEHVADMEPTKFSKHVQTIKKNYRRAPVNVNVKPAAVPAEGGSAAASDRFEIMKQAAIKAQAKYTKEAK